MSVQQNFGGGQPVPVDPIEAEVDAIMADYADPELTPKQKDFVASGAILLGESDRSETGGVPIGEDPNDTAGVRVRVAEIIDDTHHLRAEYTLGGNEDAIVREVASRYAVQGRQARSMEDRASIIRAAHTEIAALKSAAMTVPVVEPLVRPTANPPRRPTTSPPMSPTTPAPGRPLNPPPMSPTTPPPVARNSVRVTIPLGPEYGEQECWCDDVIINRETFVLVMTPGHNGWRPPRPSAAGRPRVMTFFVAGLDQPVMAYPMGLDYEYAGRVHYVLLIDRSAE